MKKIFTLIAALFSATISFAETEVELELADGHTLLISTIEAAGGVDTDIIRFYITNTVWDATAVKTDDNGNEYNPTSREGWGIGGFANSDNWTPKVEWTGKAGGSWTYEYTVAEIKETAGDEPGESHGIGITRNIYCDCAIDKVTIVLSTDPAPTTSNAIWEGECSFGNWAEGFSIAAEKFASVVENDIIEFVYTTVKNESQPWYQFKTIFSDTDETLSSNASELNDWGCATVSDGSTSYKIKLNAADIAKLQEKGMYVNGKDIIVTQVNIIHQETTGIADVKTVKAQKTVRYNLAGQQVDASYKGVVIENGKKFVVK